MQNPIAPSLAVFASGRVFKNAIVASMSAVIPSVVSFGMTFMPSFMPASPYGISVPAGHAR